MRIDEWMTLCTVSDEQIEVFERRPDGNYNLYRNTRCCQSRFCYVNTIAIGVVDRIPTHSVPAELGHPSQTGQRRVSYCQKQQRARAQHSETPTSFAEYVQGQDEHIQQLLEHADLSEASASGIISHLYQHRNIVAGTDGGLLNGHGTFGFVWATRDETAVLSKGCGEVPGHPVSMSSTRTELCGLFAALTYMRLAMEHQHMTMPRGGVDVTIYCDSKAAIQRVQDLAYDEFGTTWRCRANYDIEAALRQCTRVQSSLKIKWTWVRGHARRRKKPEKFTQAEVLNEAADDLATAARAWPLQQARNHWPEQHISLVGPRGRISGRLATEIRYCCTAPDLESYWQQRYGWTAPQIKMIDLVGTRAVSRGMQVAKARRIQKLRCGWLPVNSRETRMDPDRQAGCSACSRANLTPETVDHLYLCESTERRRAILDRFQSFHFKLRELKTATHIIRALQTGSIAWIEGRQSPNVETLMLPDNKLGLLISRAYQEQNELGWNVLFRGFWTKSWRMAQEEEFSNMRSRDVQDTGKRWAARTQLWYYDLFELIWGLRNADEHGADTDTQRLIRISKCERAVRRLYDKGEDLPYAERHPFRDSVEHLLNQSVVNQELWITKTSSYLDKAFKRARARPPGQLTITSFFPQLHG